jgi:predicted SAM-dependent methyltransferase
MRKLEIGCADRPTPGFLHQDVFQHPGVHYDYICLPWEIEDAGFDVIIACGVMEHLRFDDFYKTISHFFSILNPFGIFYFDVPNLIEWCRYYIDNSNKCPTPFPRKHILRTLYGWQRWEGDEHKSGWSKYDLNDFISDFNNKILPPPPENDKYLYKFSINFEGPEIYTQFGISRGRFTNPLNAHLYIKLVKQLNIRNNNA